VDPIPIKKIKKLILKFNIYFNIDKKLPKTMFEQTIRLKVNKIDNNLKELFNRVNFKEKTIRDKFYFEISATSDFENLLESFETKRAKVLVRIEKKNLTNDEITWSYAANPLNENSDWIVRTSNIEKLASDIHSVVTKKQLSKDYLKSLQTVWEPINESFDYNEIDEVKEPLDNIKSLLEKLEIKITKIETTILESIEMFSIPDQIWRFHHKGYINLTDMFRIETVLKNQPGVNLVLFREGYIEVNFNL
jgi:DNA repair exonuclease SbcCD ATPase subunit